MNSTKTFNDLTFEQDTDYPHEKLNQPPKYNATFTANGYTVSVIYGGGSYSANRTYEVAVFSPEEGVIPLDEFDTVLGWRTKQEITKIMKVVQLRPDLLKPRTIAQIFDEADV